MAGGPKDPGLPEAADAAPKHDPVVALLALLILVAVAAAWTGIVWLCLDVVGGWDLSTGEAAGLGLLAFFLTRR